MAGGLLQYALMTNTAKPFIESGQVKALAVTTTKRVVALPETPTFKEAGSDFTSDGWVGYVAAAGTPRPILDKLSAAFVQALKAPDVRQKLTAMGYVVSGNGPEAFTTVLHESTKQYSELLKSGAIKLD